MKRKLINFETFEKAREGAVSYAGRELAEATDVLSAALEVESLELDSFGTDHVVYETLDGSYVRADYKLDSKSLVLENIEEIVIDEDTANRASRKLLGDMVEALISNETAKAGNLFSEFISRDNVRRSLMEAGRPEGFVRPSDEAKKAGKSRSKNRRTKPAFFAKRKHILDSHPSPNNKPRRKRGSFGKVSDSDYMKRYYRQTQKGKTSRKTLNAKGDKFAIKKNMREWLTLSENVLGYVDYREMGPTIAETQVRRDEHGNVTAVRIPTSRLRTEGKLVSLSWQHMLDTELKVVREQALYLSRNQDFCKLVAEVKRHNNLSDDAALQEALERLTGEFPGVLYLTQTELSKIVAEALEALNVSNYDDQTCAFIAEGILRTAHNLYEERVNKVLKLARAEVTEGEDAYVQFQDVVHRFYPTLDREIHTEGKVFADLANAVHEVRNLAYESGDEDSVNEAEEILNHLQLVLDGRSKPDLDLAADVAEWLGQFAESLEGGDWKVSNTPHQTISGDHPAMAEKARQTYAPSQGGADAKAWQDRGTEPAFTGNKWTGVGGKDTWPTLNNPYVPDAKDFTMPGEKGVDKDWQQASGSWQSGDTWPNLQNPYVPKAVTPKMKNGAETELIVDK